jgi:hypothetical protein
VDLRKAGLLALGLAALAACRPPKSATIVPDAALMPLVPADTKVLASIRVEEVKKTPVYRELLAAEKLPQIEEFARETGLDPRKDIWEIVLASNGESMLALVRGKFTEGGIADSGKEPELAKKGVKRFPYKGYTLLGDERVVVVFFNTSVAVAGPPAAVKRAIDARDGGLGRPPAALIERVKKIPSSNQVWVISETGWQGALPEGLEGPLGGLRKLPVDVRSMVAMLSLAEGVRCEAEIVSGDAGNATKIHDAIRGVIGIGRLTTPDDKLDLLKFYDAIEVRQDEQRVRVVAELPMEIFQRLLELFRTPRLA